MSLARIVQISGLAMGMRGCVPAGGCIVSAPLPIAHAERLYVLAPGYRSGGSAA